MKKRINRRNFVRVSGIAAGGLLLGACHVQKDPEPAKTVIDPQKKKIRIGVIGTGSRGNGLIRLMTTMGGFEVVACADVLPFRLEQGLASAPAAKGYSSYEALLEDKNVEAVIIATPFSTHDEVALAALEANKHIYCEKTMVKGIAEIQAVLEKASQSDLVFQTGHQYHSSLLYKKVREIIQSGNIGDVTSYECQWNRNGDWRRPVPDPKYERMVNWRMYREYSGGLVAELMSHQIDFINWVTSSFPAKITGFGGIDHWKDGRETFDNVHLLFQYPSGLDASFTCTTTNGHEDYQIRVLGSKATILLDYTHAEIYAENFDEKELGLVDGVTGATLKAWERGEGVPIKAPGNDPTIDALAQFHSAVVDGTNVISDIHSGATTSKCVQIALDALYDGEMKYWKDYPIL